MKKILFLMTIVLCLTLQGTCPDPICDDVCSDLETCEEDLSVCEASKIWQGDYTFPDSYQSGDVDRIRSELNGIKKSPEIYI